MAMMQLPPANYDHSFDGQVVEHRLSNEAAAMACARIGVSGASCMIKSGATCVIYIPTGYGKAMTAYYNKHEVAHCNGWPPYHPGGRFVEIKEQTKKTAALRGRPTFHLFSFLRAMLP
jgi:hypothetical protein